MTNKVITQVKATRESGQVERFHALPNVPKYTVAEHCYGVVSLLLLLHPNPSLNLIRACQFHDLPERWLGDLPAPAKWDYPELALAYGYAERDVFNQLELSDVIALDGEELIWLKVLDVLELFQWSAELLEAGHKTLAPCAAACMERLDGISMPDELAEYWANYKQRRPVRLSDKIGEVTWTM